MSPARKPPLPGDVPSMMPLFANFGYHTRDMKLKNEILWQRVDTLEKEINLKNTILDDFRREFTMAENEITEWMNYSDQLEEQVLQCKRYIFFLEQRIRFPNNVLVPQQLLRQMASDESPMEALANGIVYSTHDRGISWVETLDLTTEESI